MAIPNAQNFDVRIILKNDDLATWQSSPLVLEKGEIALAKVTVNQKDPITGDTVAVPTYLMKVGDGASTFSQLNWLTAPAADVYGWAKEQSLFINKDGNGNVVSGIEWDATLNNGKGGVKYTTAAVATAEGLEGLQDAVAEIEEELKTYGDIVTHNASEFKTVQEAVAETGAANKTLKISQDANGKITATPVDIAITHDQVTDFDSEVKTLAAAEIERLIKVADTDTEDGHTIQSIQNLVDYVEQNADAVLALNEDVATAKSDAASAVETANGASTTAGQALEKANEALEGAAGAAASAAAAAESASAAATKAGEAASSATAASTAQGKAEEAQEAAENAKTAAETAQTKAEAAQTAAEAAKDAAVASNTSATAVANEAKGLAESANTTAGEAKTIAEGAAEAVFYLDNSLAPIAKTGSTDDLVQGTKVIVLNCGGAN